MKILGNRVYILMPELPESNVKLLPETQDRLKEEMRAKFDKLTVYGVGEGAIGVTLSVKEGDVVFVDPAAVRRAVILKIEDKEIMCVSGHDIQHIW